MARTRLVRAVVLCTLVALIPAVAGAQATFQGISTLPGNGTTSVVFDATRANGVIYAVGSSGVNNSRPVSWDGSTGLLTALPNLVTPNPPVTSSTSAYAISRDGAFIASQARSTVGGATSAVRVTRPGFINQNLAASPFPSLVPSTLASSISADGSIVYGLSGNPSFRAYRFDTTTSTNTLIPLPAGTTDTQNAPTIKGTSADGSVLVGVTFPAGLPTGTNTHAFRYVHGTPVGTATAIPLLPGGSWNNAIAVSADGTTTVVAGNSPDYPNGELYLHNASTGELTPLGSPNTPWAPQGWAGMSNDGVIAVTFFGDAVSGRHAYLRNGQGWFNLASALFAQGINISADGWDVEGMGASGISPDGTLVFGSGLHNGVREGFVAEFPAGFLAKFDVLAVPLSDTSIVGAWTIADGTDGGVVMMADGTYYHLDASHGSAPAGENTSGFERGRISWDSAAGMVLFTTLQDTNGDVGLSGANGIPVPAVVSGDSLLIFGGLQATRLVGPAGTPIGSWVLGDARFPNSSAVLMLMAGGHFVFAVDGGHHDGIEAGTYVIGAGGTITFTSTIDTSGSGGLTGGPGSSEAFGMQLSNDELHLILTDADGPNDFTRVVDPVSVVPAITSGLSASGVADQPFTYTITATHAASFGASGLPAGLTLDSATGVISGAPNAAGTYPIVISATNSFGSTGSATLTLVVAPSKVRLVANTVFTRNLAGQYVATITFTNVGNTPATDAAIDDIALNKTAGVPGAIALPAIAPGESVDIVETFPASAASGKKDSFRLQVKWAGGSLTMNDKVTLP
jgi:hypothetical protein